MAFTFVNSNQAGAGASSTTLQVTVTGVGAGNLIVIVCGWGLSSDTTLTVTDPNSTFTNGTLLRNVDPTPDNCSAMAYLLSSVSSGSVTYTMTLGTAAVDLEIQAWAFSYSGTASLGAANAAQGNSTAPNSGNISPSGTDLVVMGAAMIEGADSVTASAPLINGAAAEGSNLNFQGVSNVWYDILSAGFSNGAASCTFDVAKAWVANVMAFKAVEGGAAPSAYTVLYGPRVPQWV